MLSLIAAPFYDTELAHRKNNWSRPAAPRIGPKAITARIDVRDLAPYTNQARNTESLGKCRRVRSIMAANNADCMHLAGWHFGNCLRSPATSTRLIWMDSKCDLSCSGWPTDNNKLNHALYRWDLRDPQGGIDGLRLSTWGKRGMATLEMVPGSKKAWVSPRKKIAIQTSCLPSAPDFYPLHYQHLVKEWQGPKRRRYSWAVIVDHLVPPSMGD